MIHVNCILQKFTRTSKNAVLQLEFRGSTACRHDVTRHRFWLLGKSITHITTVSFKYINTTFIKDFDFNRLL